MARATQPVTIQVDELSVEFDALIDESQTLEADIPTYPTEQNFEVSDTIILKALTLSMTLFVTNTPVTWASIHTPGPTRVHDIIQQLQDIYFAKKPVTVITTDKTYENMGITSIELSKKLETGTSREIPIEFQEIRQTESQTTTIPDSYGRSGKTGANAGTANTSSVITNGTSTGTGSSTSESDSNNNPSVAKSIKNWITGNDSGLTSGGGALGGVLGVLLGGG